jgi:hypothetical protein
MYSIPVDRSNMIQKETDSIIGLEKINLIFLQGQYKSDQNGCFFSWVKLDLIYV